MTDQKYWREENRTVLKYVTSLDIWGMLLNPDYY